MEKSPVAKPGKVLLIGDSISVAYTPYAAEALGGQVAVAHSEGNAEDSRRVRERLDDWLAADADAAVVHFNCGLHDLKLPRDGRGHQVPLEAYMENLQEIVERLKASGRRLIWATTTPVIYERHRWKGFDRREEDVQAYNAAAAGIMTAHAIPINDLHEVVVRAGTEACLRDDGVHMTAEASRRLGRAVAEAVVNCLKDST